MTCLGFFALITVWVFFLAGVWGVMPTPLVLIVPSAERAWQTSHPEKPVDKWLASWHGWSLELSLGLRPRISHSWRRVGMKTSMGIFRTFFVCLSIVLESWIKMYAAINAIINLYVSKTQRLFSQGWAGSLAVYGPASGDTLPCPHCCLPPCPLKSKGSWEWPMGSIAQRLPTAKRQL